MSKKMRTLVVCIALLVLAFSSLACDDGDLVGGMQDAGSGGQEALDELDSTVESIVEDVVSIEAPDVYGVGDDALDAAGDVVADIAENSGLEAAAEGGAVMVCVVGCDAMYGPLAPVFSDTETMAACVANCQ